MCHRHVRDCMGTPCGRRAYPVCDKRRCHAPPCPTFAERPACRACQRVARLAGEEAMPCLRDEGTSRAHEPHLPRCRPCPSHLRTPVPRLVLIAPLSSVPVGFPSGPRAWRVRGGTRAIRAALPCAPPVPGEAPALSWRTPDASRPGAASQGAPPPPSLRPSRPETETAACTCPPSALRSRPSDRCPGG